MCKINILQQKETQKHTVLSLVEKLYILNEKKEGYKLMNFANELEVGRATITY